MKYVDLILPLPLPGRYTYEVPDEIEGKVEVGMRVYVQFGKSKYYTGIIDRIHTTSPKDYTTKPILALLDDKPSIRYPQRKLWSWLADYYLCSDGEVYKAAIPSGLKIESETYVSVNDDYEMSDGSRFSENDLAVIEYLRREGRMRLDHLSSAMNQPGLGARVSRLMKRGVIVVDEKAVERYRAKKETCIRLLLERGDHEGLHELFDKITKSARQQKGLIAYLDKSRWLNSSRSLEEVTRKELLEVEGVSPAVLRGMVQKGIFEEYTRVVNRFSKSVGEKREVEVSPLSVEQKRALEEIRGKMRDYAVTLLHGVTGSGKTEIYTHLIKEELGAGKQVLFLVPEISLTTQLTDRLRSVFGDLLIVYHSKFSDSERVDIWNRILGSTDPMIVLGVRSSVFLPFHHLGLVIVDEEHESSYKQYDPAPRYNGRDAGIVLAGLHGAKTLLGSATPAIDTYYKATHGKFGLVELTERYEGAVLPEVEIVDMKEQRRKKLNRGILSSPLLETTKGALQSGHQAIMFQNRRGFAPYVVCKECGWTPKCKNCDVSLVYHKKHNELHCHYCGYVVVPTKVCPACGLNGIEVYGYGTERIAEEVHECFEDYRVVRMDLDTTRNKDSYSEIIDEFSRKETDILVGTQMVTKGLDFDKVSVVGVLNADTLLNFPDFRSSERSFNMLEQVSGRAGRRRSSAGKVFIQTTDPENNILRHVKSHDYQSYYQEELADRKMFMYPPFTRIINIYLKHKDDRVLEGLAVSYTLALKDIFGERVLGPEKPYVSRLNNWYVRSIMLKVESNASMSKVKGLLRELYVNMSSDRRLRYAQVYYDVDPV